MFKNASRAALTVAISAFVLVALIDPADKILHAKVPLFVLVFCVWLIRLAPGFVRTGGPRFWTTMLFFVVLLPGIATAVALTGSSLPDNEPGFSMLKSSAVILLIPVIVSEKINLVNYVVRSSIVIALLTLAMVAIRFASPVVYLGLYEFTLEKSNAYMSPRNMLGLGIGSFYYATIAVVVFPIAYWFRKLINDSRKLTSVGFLAIFVAASLCSDSRAVAVSVFSIFVVFTLQKLRLRAGIVPTGIVLLAMLIAPAGILASFFDSSDGGNNIKLGHASSYAVLFEDHPEYMAWGQGADTEFYTEGTESKQAATELTYLELIRQVGLPASTLIFLVLLFPVVRLARMKSAESYLAVPYAAYLFEAGTNPLLVSSTGLLVVSAVWGLVLMRQYEPTGAPHELTNGIPA